MPSARPSYPDGGSAAARTGPATVVAFLAHPDDEALLAGGSLALLAARGHRVVVVLATDGGAGLSATSPGARLAELRRAEAERSRAALGAARLVLLGYGDSGMAGQEPGATFCRADPEQAAARLADVLTEERPALLVVHDRHGGYGHPDHRRAYEVGMAGAQRAGVPRVVEATVDRQALRRAMLPLRALPMLPAPLRQPPPEDTWSSPDRITHCLDVRAALPAKRAALAAHQSQRSGGGEARTLAVLLRLPRPLLTRVLGREWFVEQGRPGGRPWCSELLAGDGP